MDNQQLLNEIWKDIPGYQGYYQISSLGKVKSLKRLVNSSRSAIGLRTVGERILKTRIDISVLAFYKLKKGGSKNVKEIKRYYDSLLNDDHWGFN